VYIHTKNAGKVFNNVPKGRHTGT